MFIADSFQKYDIAGFRQAGSVGQRTELPAIRREMSGSHSMRTHLVGARAAAAIKCSAVRHVAVHLGEERVCTTHVSG